MAAAGLHREKALLRLGVLRVLDECYDLPRPGVVIRMFATNLRNRPLNSWGTMALRKTMYSLYYDLVTGSRVYPDVKIKDFFSVALIRAPFGQPDTQENCNSPLLQEPAGVTVPPPDSYPPPPPPTIQSPVHPESLDLYLLKSNSDNNVSVVTLCGRRMTRVISVVYSSDGTELANRWKVTTYNEAGQCLMSVLCKFDQDSTVHAQTPRQMKRKSPDDESSSQAPPRKRLRL